MEKNGEEASMFFAFLRMFPPPPPYVNKTERDEGIE